MEKQKKPERKTPENPFINEFEFRYWTTFVLISAIDVFIGWMIYHNFSAVSGFFDSLKLSALPVREVVSQHLWETLAVSGLYLTALAFWKFKKGVFTESEYIVRFWSGILLYRIFNAALLFPFLYYLLLKVFTGDFRWLWIGAFLLLYILFLALFSLPMWKGGKFFDKGWVQVFLFIGGITSFVACFFVEGLWEPFLVAFISGILFPSSDSLLRTYGQSIDNYDAIRRVHFMSNEYLKAQRDGSFQKKTRDFINGVDYVGGNPVSLPMAFTALEPLGNMALVWAFGLAILAWIFDFNAITAVYTHVTLIICALHLWIISNKFPMEADIRIGKKWLKGVFLLERTESKVLIMDEKWKRLFNPSDVSEIYIPKKIGKL